MSDLGHFLDEAKELLPAAVALRRRIHAHPELGLDLPMTTEAVLDGLKGLDVEIVELFKTDEGRVPMKSRRWNGRSLSSALTRSSRLSARIISWMARCRS